MMMMMMSWSGAAFATLVEELDVCIYYHHHPQHLMGKKNKRQENARL